MIKKKLEIQSLPKKIISYQNNNIENKDKQEKIYCHAEKNIFWNPNMRKNIRNDVQKTIEGGIFEIIMNDDKINL